MRAVRLAVGAACYAAFFATFLYLIAWVGDLPFVARSVDRGPAGPLTTALIIDLALIALFGVQHSVMARPGFKAAWTRAVPPALERSAYVLLSSLALIVLFTFWRPVAGLCWSVGGAAGTALLVAGYLGWGLVLLSTFLISHFELFGLSQVWRGTMHPPGEPKLTTPFLYRWVRHPLYLGFVIAFWVTPEMSASRALFAAGMTLYILIGIAHEERDLIATFGDDYRHYRERVGGLFPRFGRS